MIKFMGQQGSHELACPPLQSVANNDKRIERRSLRSFYLLTAPQTVSHTHALVHRALITRKCHVPPGTEGLFVGWLLNVPATC